MLARTENGFGAVDALQSGAAAARLALVARHGGVAEVRTACALQDVASNGRHVAQLARGREKQRLTHDWIALANPRVPRDIAHARETAEAEATVRQVRDCGECCVAS